MDLGTIGSLGTIGLLSGALVAAAKGAGLADKFSPLTTLALGVIFGLAYQSVGFVPHFVGASGVGQYVGAGLVGLYSAAAWEGLTNTVAGFASPKT